MNTPNTNAFTRQPAGQTQFPRKGLAGLLAPLRAELTERTFGWSLALEPMHASDATRPWRRLDPSGTCAILIVPATDRPVAHADANDPGLVDHIDLACRAVKDALDGYVVVLIDGPVEPGDVRAIRSALDAGRSPLDAEVRAVAAMRIEADRTVRIDTRTREQAAYFVAENLRLYLAAVCSSPGPAVELPETRMVEYLLERTGRLTVRPIETEIYSTFVDVGVNTDAAEAVRPADASLIYDLPGRSWHGDV